jgi:uncharacterized membrane protein YeaQ/YmgE (transglycosylase-associated protein family)
MFDFSEVLAWIAIGAGAGMVGALWHARRDAAGVLSKLLVGPAGAVIGGALAAVMFPYGRARMRLFDAALFAFIALALLHVVWAVANSRRKPHEPDLEQDAPGNQIPPQPRRT